MIVKYDNIIILKLLIMQDHVNIHWLNCFKTIYFHLKINYL